MDEQTKMIRQNEIFDEIDLFLAGNMLRTLSFPLSERPMVIKAVMFSHASGKQTATKFVDDYIDFVESDQANG